MKKEKIPAVPLWEEEELKICRFCAYARRIAASEDVFCERKKQPQSEENTCKKYRYDILKKELRRRRAAVKKYNKGDFEI